MNYAQLVTAIKGYIENYEDDFITNLPAIVKQAEQRIYNAVQIPALRKNVTGTTTASNRFLSAPDDFLSVFSMAVVLPNGSYQYLIDKDVNFLREAYPNPATTAAPKYYALFGPQSANAGELSFLLAPTPDVQYTVELHYNHYPESIVDASNTWLGDNFDSVLLYGCLVEAYIFMKGEPDLIKTYDDKFKEALTLLKVLGDGKDRGDTYRTQQVKYPVP